MNYREDLEFQLQKVTLAIQEVIEDVYISDEVRQERIRKLINFKEAITVSYTHLTLPTIYSV